jgi:nicotinate-nucleotide adenylyltransferase
VPPLKSKDLAPEEDRLAMTSKAVLPNPFYDVSDIELFKKEKSYTIDTIR